MTEAKYMTKWELRTRAKLFLSVCDSFMKMQAQFQWFSISEIKRIEYLFFIEMAFNLW